MTRRLISVILALFFISRAAFAQQEMVWVQIEAQPSLAQAQNAIRNYASRLQDVNGFSLGGGWYGIALGPYARGDAERVLSVYRTEGQIPQDSFIAFKTSFQQQFWPIGTNQLAATPSLISPPQSATRAATPSTQETPTPQLQAEPSDENPRQARQSEALLDREEKKLLQVALKWAGFYNSAIDGAFGRGTRGSMRAWQEANNYEPTGVLTTLQRAALIRDYNSVLDGLDLQVIADEQAGIQIAMPLGAVEFAKYQAPFAHYDAKGDIDARVLLISQAGNQDTLFGLYDIMQTLRIVPETGPRERKTNSFILIGESATLVSHTQVTLKDGEIKGFTLIWPAGDEERRTRLLGEMQKSFARIDGVLDPAAGTDEEQSIDLVSGLEIRRPKLSRSGFYIDQKATVVTTIDAVRSCRKITIDTDYEADIVTKNETLGVAVLRAREALVPSAVASLLQSKPRLQSDVAVSGFSYEGILGAPTLTFGKLADIRGLQGEEQLNRLALNALPGDAGGPVFDAGGAVMGMLLPTPNKTRKLPDEVAFAADAVAIGAFLTQAGLEPAATEKTGNIAPEDLSTHALGITVLVSCWE